MSEYVDTNALAQALARELAPSIAPLFERAARMEELLRRPQLSPEEVAEVYGANPRTLANWRSDKKGPAYVKTGGLVFYRRKDLEAFFSNARVRTRDQQA